jgi:hypothetical protein
MTNTPLANIAASDNFALAAGGSQSSAIVGERLRFVKGQYLVGKGDYNPLPEGTELQAVDIAAAWVKFVDDKPVDTRIGFPMAERDELGDNDPEEWPFRYGAPADPWSNQRYLYLIDPKTGADYTFVTSSWGGRDAVTKLARQIAVKRAAVPGAVATVRLEVGFKRSQQYGQVPAPRFEVVGWSGGNAPVRTVAADLDDEIPF